MRIAQPFQDILQTRGPLIVSRSQDDARSAGDDAYDPEEPFHSPVRRFDQLPPDTRRFLEQLRKEDIEKINKAVRFYNLLETVGKFNSWLIVGAMTIFITFAAFGEAIRKVLGWMASGGGK